MLAFAPIYEITITDSLQLTALETYRDKIVPLTWNRAEVTAISKQLTGKDLSGESATEHAFKTISLDYQVLHLAMHLLIIKIHLNQNLFSQEIQLIPKMACFMPMSYST